MKNLKNKLRLNLRFVGVLFLILLFAILFTVGCASNPEPVPKRLAGPLTEVKKVEPDWTIKTPNTNGGGRSSILEIYIVGDEFLPNFFWIIEKGNWKLDSVERLAALSFLQKKGVDTDSAEIKNEPKIMFVYPQKQGAANHEQNKEDANIIIGAND